MAGVRALLVGLPAALLLILAQSVLWVPGYAERSSAGPERLRTFVEASIGDARLLNPILNADTASSRISELLFDGLLRVDEDLKLTGAIASRWELSERAFLAVPEGHDARALATQLAQRLRAAHADLLSGPPRVRAPFTRDTSVVPPGGGEPVPARVSFPERIELRLSRVVPELGDLLSELPGFADLERDLERASRVDANGTRLPAETLAELLPALEHNPEIVFRLRPGVRFHDGHPLDADDVVFTWRAIMDPRNLSPRRSDFEPVQEVVALDSLTVRVRYKRLFSPAVNVWTIGILPRHLLDEDAMRLEMSRRELSRSARERFGMRDSEFNRDPVGTGPFRFGRWDSDELIHLVRNEDYFDDAPLLHDYYYRILPDKLTQELEFRAGAIDTYQAEPHQAQRYRRDPRYRAFSAVLPGYTYIGYNLRKPPFDDPRVRRALGMAIDVDAIIRYALFDEGERVTGPYASITRWYDRSVRPLPYDPEAAERLLAQAGWRRGPQGWLERDGTRLEFNLITNNGNLRRKAVASIAQQAWQRLGVKCNVQLFEWAVFLKDFINPGAFDAVVLGWRLGLDPDLHAIWHSSQRDPNELNFVGLSDPATDRLIEELRRTYDLDGQERLAHRLHRRIAELQPYTFLYAPRSTRLLDRSIAMREPGGGLVPVRAGGAGDVFHFMNRWLRADHDPG